MSHNDPVRSDFALLARKRVRYHEVDMQNVVFNANYLVYADIAVTEYFRALLADKDGHDTTGTAYFGPDGDVMVRHSTLDFRAGAKADDQLDIGVRVASFGRTSFTMEFAIFRDDALLVVIRTRYVYVTTADWRPAPVPDDFRTRVTGFEKLIPEPA